MGTRGVIWSSLGLAAVVLLAALTGVVILDFPPDPRATDTAQQPTNASYPFLNADDSSENDGNDSSENDGNNSDTPDDGTSDEREEASDDAPTTERSNFELADLAGLAALIAIVLGTLFLVRRAPR
jgi:hypothetical protein